MRKRVVWIIYCVGVLAGGLSLAWVSLESIRLDQARELALQETERARLAESQAKRQIELQDRISQVVWVLDVMLAPLIAQESTRPVDVYQPFVQREVPSKGGPSGGVTVWEPSPLLSQPSEFIKLHFQVSGLAGWTSPQVPTDQWYELASERGLLTDEFDQNSATLGSLCEWSSFNALATQLPQGFIQNYSTPELAMNTFGYNGTAQNDAVSQTYALGEDSLRQFNRQQESSPPSQAPSFPQVQSRSGSLGQVAEFSQQAETLTPQQRGVNDLNRRNRVIDTFANSAMVSQQLGLKGVIPVDKELPFGVTRPLWIDGRLILARKTRLPNQDLVVQGCWIDWEKLKEQMRVDVAEFLPVVDFVPVDEQTEIEPSHLLATLPVQISVPLESREETVVAGAKAGGRPILATLLAAWIGLIGAALAGGGLLFNAEALSERRARFVSSVTHELRTPLTTFRMYTEMLKNGMVSDEVARNEYLDTLHLEADRLTHLVENVLSYSRLEHGGKRAQRMQFSVEELLDRIGPRLQNRVAPMGRRLEIRDELTGSPKLETDPIAVEQILSNLVDNACKYGHQEAEIPFELHVVQRDSFIVFRVCDQGPGVPVDRRDAIFGAFQKSDLEAARTAPGIGLGLALSRRLALDLNGKLRLDESWVQGACFEFLHPISQRRRTD